MSAPALVEHFFRRDYGRLVALLVRRVGVHHLELVEDAVQHSLMNALGAWTRDGQPSDPGGWLYKASWHRLVQDLRRDVRREAILGAAPPELMQESPQTPDPAFAGEIRDDMLRMLFVCCDENIPRESQLVLALKILCGFSTTEISLRLFISEANVHKRLSRARDRLRQMPADLELPSLQQLAPRLSAVQAVLYLIFNEGYLSARADRAIRRELCEEAVRLGTLVAEHPVGASPESFALLALMHLHSSRLDSRLDATGDLLLLEEQDRRRWNRDHIADGMQWLKRSASGDVFSRYHAEAGIAAEHCLAPSAGETRWNKIAALYEMLEKLSPSPLHAVNRAVAVAEWQGPAAALAMLDQLVIPAWLADSYVLHAVMSDLHRRAGHTEVARDHRERALRSAPTAAVQNALQRRLTGLD